MNQMRNCRSAARLLALASTVVASVASSVGCGDVARQGRSANFLVIDTLLASRGAKEPGPLVTTLVSDVLTSVTSPAPCTAEQPCPTIFNDLGQVELRLSPKDVGTAGVGNQPSSNNQVTISRYRVVYRRTDGRNTPGVDVPYAFDGGATATILAGSTATIGFEIVRHDAKRESPLAQLVTEGTVISTIAEVTFYGRDQVGNDINVTGSIQIDFGNFGDF
jgi:hypothetical protein